MQKIACFFYFLVIIFCTYKPKVVFGSHHTSTYVQVLRTGENRSALMVSNGDLSIRGLIRLQEVMQGDNPPDCWAVVWSRSRLLPERLC